MGPRHRQARGPGHRLAGRLGLSSPKRVGLVSPCLRGALASEILVAEADAPRTILAAPLW